MDTSTVPGGYAFDRLRDELASRIAAVPEFRAKLADSQLNLDYPVWVDDDAFDLDRLLLRIGPDLMPDLWRLADDFNVALEELLDCSGPARV